MEVSGNAQVRGHRTAWAAITLLFVGGCASQEASWDVTPRHEAPMDGPTARLVMRGAVDGSDRFAFYVFDDGEHCAGRRTLGVGQRGRHPATVTIAANAVQTVEFLLVKATRHSCVVRLSFEPAPGRSYLLNGAVAAGGCTSRVLDMTDPDDMRPERSLRHRNPGAAVCLPLADSRRFARPAAAPDASGDAVLRPGARADDLRGLIAP